MLVFQKFFQLLSQLAVDDTAVETQGSVLRHNLCQILFLGRNALLTGFHEEHAGSFQLLRRLYEIPAVGPESRLCLRDNRRTCGPCKTSDKFPAFKIIAHVFRLMKIGGWNHVSVNLALRHQAS